MPIYNVGQLIKDLRIQKNIKQEELAFGIMDRTTLSKIERGLAMPSKAKLEALFEKLGYNPNLTADIYMNTEETEIQKLKDELTVYLSQRRTEEADVLLERVKAEGKFEGNPMDKQFLLAVIAANEINKGNKDKAVLNMIMEALSLSIPDFCMEKVETYLLSVQEIRLINLLASAYFISNVYDKSIHILYKLKMNLEIRMLDKKEMGRHYPHLIVQLTRFLLEAHYYKEVPPLCEEGLTICKQTGEFYFLPSISWNKAVALLELGEKETAKELLRDIYHAYRLFGSHYEQDLVKKYAKDKLGVDF